MGQNSFLYFAYGSNLLEKRIHVNSPSAKRVGIGKIKNYQLDFSSYSKRWHGSAATINPKNGSIVWGAIWELNVTNRKDLDIQEGVNTGVYFPFEIDVYTPDDKILTCIVYQMNDLPETLENIEDLPRERLPSAVYLKVLRAGAQESKLPQDYQDFLAKIPDNGYCDKVDVGLDISDLSI